MVWFVAACSRCICALTFVVLAWTGGAWAQTAPAPSSSRPAPTGLRLNAIFGDSMVLQRGEGTSVFGLADPGERVTVTFLDQKKMTVADNVGRWTVRLDPLVAGGPHELTVAAPSRTIALRDVLVGDVWVCSGQSNMEWTVSKALNAPDEIAAADFARIRLNSNSRWFAKDARQAWVACSPKVIGSFSATAYYFGRELSRRVGDVPLGLVVRAVGGTVIRQWTPRSGPTIEDDPDLAFLHAEWKQATEVYAQYGQEYARWKDLAARAKTAGQPAPPTPLTPVNPRGWGWQFDTQIAPLMPMAIRGVLWYQGETDARTGRWDDQRRLFPALVKSWRKAWGQGDFAFVAVQLANDWGGGRATQPSSMPTAPPESHTWPWVREAQASILSLPNTALAVTIDIGGRMHFPNKQDVGKRAAIAAAGKFYGVAGAHMGPVYDSMRVEEGRIRLRFTHLGGGLWVKEGQKLWGFSIAGEDRRFVWADAAIDGDTVIVWSSQVPKPASVRYGWLNDPRCNLYNAAGLPAMPFRTDDWPRAASVTAIKQP